MARLIINTFFDKKLDFRVRLFNVLAMAGTLISLLMAIAGFAIGAGFTNVIANIITACISFILLYYSYRSGKYQQCYAMTIFFLFMLLFPVLFFSAGGYHSGMPAFFVFAVMFTVFMLEGKMAFVMATLEILLYIGICLFAYRFPESVNALSTDTDVLTDIIIGFVTVSVVMGTTMFLHFKIYNEQQRELELARKMLSKENAALELLNQLKTEFLGNISHELKTPLTVVSGYAQVSGQQLASQPENEAIQEKMKIIASEADRLALMVGQILDVTRIEEGRMHMETQPCRIDEIIHSAVDTHFPILNKNDNKLMLQIESGLPRVNADPARTAQVIVNLVANAIRFTNNGVITISACQNDGFVDVSVTDTGRGIEPERIATIFDRFNHNKKSGADTGTGLGLFICKNIIESQGGSIIVESRPGVGSAFRFTIPVAA